MKNLSTNENTTSKMKLTEVIEDEIENSCNGIEISKKNMTEKPLQLEPSSCDLPNGSSDKDLNHSNSMELHNDSSNSNPSGVGDLLVEDTNPSRHEDEDNRYQNGGKGDDTASVSSCSSNFPVVEHVDDMSDEEITLRLSDDEDMPAQVTNDSATSYFSSPFAKIDEKQTNPGDSSTNVNTSLKVEESVKTNAEDDKMAVDSNTSVEKSVNSDDFLEDNLISDLNEQSKSALKDETKKITISDLRQEIEDFIKNHDNEDNSQNTESQDESKTDSIENTKEVSSDFENSTAEITRNDTDFDSKMSELDESKMTDTDSSENARDTNSDMGNTEDEPEADTISVNLFDEKADSDIEVPDIEIKLEEFETKSDELDFNKEETDETQIDEIELESSDLEEKIKDSPKLKKIVEKIAEYVAEKSAEDTAETSELKDEKISEISEEKPVENSEEPMELIEENTEENLAESSEKNTTELSKENITDHLEKSADVSSNIPEVSNEEKDEVIEENSTENSDKIDDKQTVEGKRKTEENDAEEVISKKTCLSETNESESFEMETTKEAETEVVDKSETELVDKAETEVVDKSKTEIADKSKTEIVDNKETEVVNKAETEVVSKAETEVVSIAETKVVSEAETEVVDKADTEVVDKANTEVVDQAETEVVDEMETDVVDKTETEVVSKAETEVVDKAETDVVDKSETDVIDKAETEVLDKPETEVLDKPETELVEKSKAEVVDTPEVVSSDDTMEKDDTDVGSPKNELLEISHNERIDDKDELMEIDETEFEIEDDNAEKPLVVIDNDIALEEAKNDLEDAKDEIEEMIKDEKKITESDVKEEGKKVSDKSQDISEDRPSLKRTLEEEDATQDAKKAKITVKKQIPKISLNFFRDFMAKKKVATLTRAELEQFCLQKMCEVITQTSHIADLNRRITKQDTTIEAWRAKYQTLSKNVRDLEVVHSRVLQEVRLKCKDNNCEVTPVKITRSVGLQVSLQSITSARARLQNSSPVSASPTASAPPSQEQIAGVKRKIGQRASLPNRSPSNTTPPAAMQPPKSPVVRTPTPGRGIKTILPKVIPTAADPSKDTANNNSLLENYLQNHPSTNKTPPAVRKSAPQSTPTPVAVTTVPKVIDLTDEDDVQKSTAGGNSIRVVPSQQLQSTSPTVSTSLPRLTYLVQGSQQGQQVLLATSASQPTRPGQVRSTLMFKPVAPGQVPQGQRLNIVRPNTVSGITVIPTNTTTTIRPGQQIRFATPIQSTRPQIRTPVIARHPAPLPGPPAVQPSQPNWKAMPPKPTLKISRVGDGIVLSWRMQNNKDMSLYEDIGSYQLYAYQETTGPPSTDMWRKVGDVKALALPMACTLTQFTDGNKYHFAVRAVDVKSRVGPFSQPEQIALP